MLLCVEQYIHFSFLKAYKIDTFFLSKIRFPSTFLWNASLVQIHFCRFINDHTRCSSTYHHTKSVSHYWSCIHSSIYTISLKVIYLSWCMIEIETCNSFYKVQSIPDWTRANKLDGYIPLPFWTLPLIHHPRTWLIFLAMRTIHTADSTQILAFARHVLLPFDRPPESDTWP